jgi:Papain family cysteine protease
LFQQGLINYESARYWFDYLSKEEFRKQFYGGDKVPEKEEKIIYGYELSNGTILDPEPDMLAGRISRRKRQTATVASVLPPECVNLPAYKNWVEEGKMAPVQNQGPCGEIEKRKNFREYFKVNQFVSGCCYVFASTASLEARVAIQYKKSPVKLSAQHTLNCLKNMTGDPSTGCKGGRSVLPSILYSINYSMKIMFQT